MASILNTCLTRQKPIDGGGIYTDGKTPPTVPPILTWAGASQVRVGASI
jgi:hypothetical protein